MMQIVPVGSDARRAAAFARVFGPTLRLMGAIGLAVTATLVLLRLRANG